MGRTHGSAHRARDSQKGDREAAPIATGGNSEQPARQGGKKESRVILRAVKQ